MRFIATFLLCLVLALTLTPCCALEINENDEHAPTQKHNVTDQSDDCCKDCSPFYVCGTCVGFTISPKHTMQLVLSEKEIKHSTAYLHPNLPLIPMPIWQPPKSV